MLGDKLVHGVPALSLKSGLPTTTSYEGRNASFVWLRLRRAVGGEAATATAPRRCQDGRVSSGAFLFSWTPSTATLPEEDAHPSAVQQGRRSARRCAWTHHQPPGAYHHRTY